jgi:hypothetical protein
MMTSPTSLPARTSRTRSSKRLHFGNQNLPQFGSLSSAQCLEGQEEFVSERMAASSVFVASSPRVWAGRGRKEHMVAPRSGDRRRVT